MKRFAALCLVFVLMAALFPPVSAHARDEGKVVRVGWYESPFNTTDRFGRRSGYAYEFQKKIAAYTDWIYEYVEASWPELLQMLQSGEIDLLSDVSYTRERSERMLYSAEPMGAEDYYLFVSVDNTEYSLESYDWLNGKRVGAYKDSVQLAYFQDWQRENGVLAKTVALACSEEEALQMLLRGELDGLVTLDAYGGTSGSVPVVKTGSSDFYFAVNKARPDLLAELNTAMSRIRDEDHFYTRRLYEKYIRTSGANLFLNAGERAWLERHGTIRVGYQDDYLAFCARDSVTGELTGALRDYLNDASVCFENARLDFEAVAYPNAEAAMKALESGEVDCMFPSNLSTADGEARGFVMTPPVMKTEVYAVVRKDEQTGFAEQERVMTAGEQHDPNYDAVIMDHFPDWFMTEYPSMDDCLRAVANRNADCVLISNYQYNDIGRLCEKYNLTALSTGKEVEYFFAVNSGDKELYSILTRASGIVSSTAINAALTYFSGEEAKTTLVDVLLDNLGIVTSIFFVIVAMLFVILAQRQKLIAERKVIESQRQVDDLSRRVYVDALTSVRNKGAFNNCIDELQARLDRGERPEFAIGVFDCDNLKLINDRYGHDKGDEYLKAATRLICRTFDHSAVFRIGGDEFAAVLENEDYEHRDELTAVFRRFREMGEESKEPWTQARVSMGIAEYDPSLDGSVSDTIRRADEMMYEHKRIRKQKAAAGR